MGAGLLVRSFAALRDVPLGFDSAHLLAVEAGPSEDRYPQPAQQRLHVDELVARVQALPGVEPAAAVTLRPLWGTVGIHLKAGRVFDERDREGQPGVVVVSEALARRYWPGQEPIGKRLKIPLPPTEYHDAWLTVVGVAGDARYRELRATRLDLYMPHRQSDHRQHHLVVRAHGDVAGLPAALQRVVRELDPEQPAPEVVAMTSVVSAALGGPRFAARVFSAFALVALLLAGLGLYGLMAYSVGRRTREFGVRAVASSLLIAIAVFASALPARRALDVQPAVALRQE